MRKDSIEFGDFMTNIDREHAELIIKAAALTNFNGVTVQDNATAYDGCPMPNYVAVYTTENRDHTEFWNCYHELKAEVENDSK
jgi:hypothetical protein